MLGSDDSDFDRFGLGLVTSMVTSNVRGLKFEGAKERTLLKCSGGTAVLYAKKGYIGHPLFYAKFWPYSIRI